MSNTLTLDVLGQNGKKTGTMTIDADKLGGRVRSRLLREVVLQQQNNRRQGTHCVKTRGKIQGTSAKPWRQKGTGRARAGNKNSPIWIGGAVAHGPKNRNYNKEIPVKIRRGALASAILGKIQSKQLVVVDTLEMKQPKTKDAAKVLDNLKLSRSILVANHSYEPNSLLSFRNLQKPHKLETIPSHDLNAYAVVSKKNLVITQKGLEDLIERVSGDNAGEGQ